MNLYRAPNSDEAHGKHGAQDIQSRPMDHGSPMHASANEVRRLLETLLQDEAPPQGLPPELLELLEKETQAQPRAPRDCDLFSLFSALTALTQEIKLQGRAFKQLTDQVQSLMESQPSPEKPRLPGGLEIILEKLDTIREAMQRAASQQAEGARKELEKDMVEMLLDIRDRLERGAAEARYSVQTLGRHEDTKTADSSQPSGPTREAIDTLEAFADAHRINLDQLDRYLERFGIRKIPAQNAVFDPTLMKAVEVEETYCGATGTVRAVHLSGFWWGDAVFRPAEVVVARRLAEPPVRRTGLVSAPMDSGSGEPSSET